VAWFAMRLNYTRSVATTSIVGHILGLGDRHPANILLDNGTGEVVHIDLGIAFDQVSVFESWSRLYLIHVLQRASSCLSLSAFLSE
jgi:hypothetical protein